MLKSEIEIDRPPATVWAFFTEPDNWELWSRLSLSTAHWHVGGSLYFEKGMTSKVEAVMPGSMVTFGDTWSEETWSFEATPSGGTLVRVDESPRSMAYTDHGAAALAKTAKALEKFKAVLEDDTSEAAVAAQHAGDAPVEPPSVVSSIPELADDDEDPGPNPSLRRITW